MSDEEMPIIGKPLKGPFVSIEDGVVKLMEREQGRLKMVQGLGEAHLSPETLAALKEFQERTQWSLERLLEKAEPDAYRPDVMSFAMSIDVYAFIQLFMLCHNIDSGKTAAAMTHVLEAIQIETNKVLELAFLYRAPAVNTEQ